MAQQAQSIETVFRDKDALRDLAARRLCRVLHVRQLQLLSPNNSFKPNARRNFASFFKSAARVGLIQALGRMESFVRSFKILACLLLLAPMAAVANDRQYDLLGAALAKLEASGNHIDTLVLTSSLAPTSRRAASRLRTTVDRSSLAPAVDQQLPNNYLLLNSIEIVGNSGTVHGTIGAILTPDPKNLFACGSGYSINLRLDSHGKWVVTNMLVEDC